MFKSALGVHSKNESSELKLLRPFMQPGTRMKVLLLLSDGPGARGGIARYNQDLLDALVASAEVEEIQVICRQGSLEAARDPKVRVLEVRAGKVAFVLSALRLARAFGSTDWVFCGHLYMAPLAALIKRYRHTQIWLQLHGIEAWQPATALIRRALKNFDRVTSVSRFTRSRFLTLNAMSPTRVQVLPNTVQVPQAEAEAEIAALARTDQLRTSRADVVNLLTVARLSAAERYKGHDRVIAALPRVRQSFACVRYLIVGSGDDQARLEALAQQHQVADSVLFLGELDRAQVQTLYHSAQLFVMPSTGEGFGISFLEAMVSGTPALGFGRDGSVDPLADGALGSIADEHNLPERIIQMLKQGRDPSLPMRVLGRFGKAHFMTHVDALLKSWRAA